MWEQCRHYVPKGNKIISTDESLRSINYEAKKRKGKNKICSLYKSETKTSTKCDVALCGVWGNAGKNAMYIKKDIWMSL